MVGGYKLHEGPMAGPLWALPALPVSEGRRSRADGRPQDR